MEWIRVPLVNANEDEVEITEVYVEEGQEVKAGELICAVESTKATVELEAPSQGYVRSLQVEGGSRAKVGALICALTKTREAEVVMPREGEGRAREESLNGEGPRATRRARALSEEYGLELGKVPHRGIVTERDVLQVLGKTGGDLRSRRDRPVLVEGGAGPAEAIVIYGAGGHARVIIDVIREGRRDLKIVGIVDDGEDRPDEVQGVPVLGSAEMLPELRERGVKMAALGVGAVTHNALRAELYERLVRLGFQMPGLIHPRAMVEPSALVGRGAQIFAGAVVGSNVELGENVIVNSNAVVSHDCRLDDHVHLTPGALLAGNVQVGARSVIGMGVTIYLGVRVGADVVVANGNHILQDVEDAVIVRTG